MRNFVAALALLACSVLAREEEQEPTPPDNSQFPDEWSNGEYSKSKRCADDSCRAPNLEEVLKYDKETQEQFAKCNPQYIRRAYCRMQTNPAYPTSSPSGFYWLWQFQHPTPGGTGPLGWNPVGISGWMTNLPYTSWRYALSINEKRWDGKDCCSSGRHLQFPHQTHGWNNWWNTNHHVGNLWGPHTFWPMTPAFSWHFQHAWKPTLFGSTSDRLNIYYKTMVLYEDRDDYGFNSDVDPMGNPLTNGSYDSREWGSAGPRIACCTITPYWIDWYAQDTTVKEADADTVKEADLSGRGRRLAKEIYGEEVEVYTPDQFRELFGFEPEKLPGEDDWIDQN